MHNPKTSHWIVVKHIRKRAHNVALHFHCFPSMKLHVYVVSDWAKDQDDCISMTSYCIFIKLNLVRYVVVKEASHDLKVKCGDGILSDSQCHRGTSMVLTLTFRALSPATSGSSHSHQPQISNVYNA